MRTHDMSRERNPLSTLTSRFVSKILGGALLLLGLASGASSLAQAAEVGIESFSRNGALTWTNVPLNVTCRVEWAASAEGPWHDSWESLTNIVVTNHTTVKAVPMFYRVVCTPPPPPWRSNINAAVALSLVESRSNDPTFTILDVRTPGEYAPRHIKGAVNVDFNSGAFAANVGQLDKYKCYLVYCASGNRSGQASTVMQGLGFTQIYNMSVGFSSFASQPGAAPFLEPPLPGLQGM